MFKKTLASEGNHSTQKAAKAYQAQLDTKRLQMSIREACFAEFAATWLNWMRCVPHKRDEDTHGGSPCVNILIDAADARMVMKVVSGMGACTRVAQHNFLAKTKAS